MSNLRESLSETKLPLGLKLGYGTGAVLDATVNTTLNIFLLFYATTACGMSPGLAGAALGLALVVDAIAEPLIALISDNHHSRFGRRLPFMLMATPVVMIGMVLLFSMPDSNNQFLLFSWLFVCSVLLRVSLSLFNLPFLAAGAEFSDDQQERTSIITLRWAIQMIAAFVAIAIGFSIFFKVEGSLAERQHYVPFAITLSAIILIAALTSMHAVRRTLARQHVTAIRLGSLFSTIVDDMRELFQSHSFRILFGVALLFATAQGVTQSLGLHANTYFWRLTTEQTQYITLSLALGLILGAPLAAPVVTRMENKTAVIIGLVGLILMQALPPALRLAGLLPLEGKALAEVLSAGAIAGGILTTFAAIALLTMITNAADEHEHRYGVRREGSYFAGWSFATKAAGGLGTLISGLALEAISFPVQESKALGMSMVLPQNIANELGFFYGPGAAVFTLAAALLMTAFHLDRKAHAAIMVDLHARRAKDLAENS